MSDQPVVEFVDVDSLPDDEDVEFDPCEEGENLPDDITLVGARAFGNTSRHVLATWLPAAFDKWGVKYKLASGWRDRGRPISAGYFDPNGLLVHHTGSTSSAAKPFPSLATIINGRSDLRGPLSQTTLGFDGVTIIVAAGRANHAGDAKAAMGNPAGDGNAMYLGNEVQTNGTQKMPQVQYDALVLSNAAILDHFGYKNADKLGLHATTSKSGKWDLGAGTGKAGVPYDIVKLRRDVTARLKAGPPVKPAPVPPAPTTPTISKGSADMQFYRIDSTVKTVADPVIASNGFQMRWLNSNGWGNIRASVKQQTGVTPEAIPVASLDGVAIEWVGPKPSATYPIPSSVKVIP